MLLRSRHFVQLSPAQKRLFAKTRATSTTMSTSVQTFIDDVNNKYESVHKAFEENFWSTKMALKGNSADQLVQTKKELDAFLGAKDKLETVRRLAKEHAATLTPEQKKTLAVFERTFLSYIIEDPEALRIKDELLELEAKLQTKRNNMQLGYKDPVTGELKPASSVVLSTLMRTHEDEAVRRACYDGMRSIAAFVSEDFATIIKLRNQLARKLGFEDFYDMQVTNHEGFNKKRLFEILDDLEVKTRGIQAKAIETLEKDKGKAALEPWNRGYMLSGDIEKRQDPYFPFVNAVDVWARCFAAMNIHYRGTTMTLDLCDRKGKYSNGFCHWVAPAWRKPDGTWNPSKTNFTSLATPSQVGSGKTALVTLMHEGGHAAHFANVDQPSPLFSQERAPTSVAYAENQSMFLDSLCGDADWMARYAHDAAGQPIPWSLIEESIRANHPYKVFMIRYMLAVSYYEKALYELPESDMTPAKILALSDEVERRIQVLASPRPLLSVPHLLADESSAYYHGYTLAEMSVYQTRNYFLSKYGSIVDNPKVGEELTSSYWVPGNSEMFLDLVQGLTGHPLTADAWVHELEVDTEAKVAKEKAAYEKAVKEGPRFPAGTSVDLGMRMILADGDAIIADTANQDLAAACAKFKDWCKASFPSQ